jgi:hypothetical protein
MKRTQSLTDNLQSLINDRRLRGTRTEGPWERAPVDQEWWRAQSLPFPALPTAGSDCLIPLSSFNHLVDEHRAMGIPLDNFWVRSVLSPAWKTACFFKWCGEIPALVLAVFGGNELTHVECLAQGDEQVPAPHRAQILENVIRAFAAAGFEVKKADRGLRKTSLN